MPSLMKVALPVLGVLLAAAFVAALVLGGMGLSLDSVLRKRPEAFTSNPVSRATIPPLDVAMPAKAETATFALG
jgi:hypothetical protein